MKDDSFNVSGIFYIDEYTATEYIDFTPEVKAIIIERIKLQQERKKTIAAE